MAGRKGGPLIPETNSDLETDAETELGAAPARMVGPVCSSPGKGPFLVCFRTDVLQEELLETEAT